jgi:hypothetical protein
MKHEVTPTNKLNDKEEAARGLEAGVEPNEEGMIGSCFKHMLLRLNPINILLHKREKQRFRTQAGYITNSIE